MGCGKGALRMEIADLTDQLATTNTNVEQLNQKCTDLESDIGVKTVIIDGIEKELKDLNSEHKELTSNYDDLNKQYEDAQNREKGLLADIQEQEIKKKEADEEIAKAVTENVAISAKKELLAEEINTKIMAIEKLREEMEDLIDEKDDEIEQLHDHVVVLEDAFQKARHYPRTMSIRNVVLSSGGMPRLKNETVCSDVTTFDPDTKKWHILTQMNEPRHHHAVAVLGGFLFVAGGEECNDQRSPLRTAWRYDPRADHWQEISPMIRARESFQLAALCGKLYAVGGRVDQDVSLDEVERYDPALDKWEMMSPISAPRRGVAIAAHNGKLYAMGGSGRNRISSKVERYNPVTNTWEHRRPLSMPRFFSLLGAVGNELYLMGGASLDQNGSVVSLDLLECYHPASDSWTLLSPMMIARAEAGIAVLNSHIYVMGGYKWDDNQRLSTVECYDTDKDIWLEVGDLMGMYTGVSCCAITVYEVTDTIPADEEDQSDDSRKPGSNKVRFLDEAAAGSCGSCVSETHISSNINISPDNKPTSLDQIKTEHSESEPEIAISKETLIKAPSDDFFETRSSTP